MSKEDRTESGAPLSKSGKEGCSENSLDAKKSNHVLVNRGIHTKEDTIHLLKKENSQDQDNPCPGRLFVVGIGPGGPLDRTRRAEEAIAQSDCVVGYTHYVALIADLTAGKELISTGMTKEVERCRLALERAKRGKTVALVSSGDPGIYGMAGLILELAATEGLALPIEIVPGVTAASALAARLGAPLMCDFAVMSLSDLLVPWERIRERLEAVAAADLVCALYNPRSQKRRKQLDEAAAIFRRHRPGATPVGVGTAIGSSEERILLSDLDHFLALPIDMRSVVIIGNGSTKRIGDWFVTPRGYGV
jgi:precorrin-3B C17-methyltransferase